LNLIKMKPFSIEVFPSISPMHPTAV